MRAKIFVNLWKYAYLKEILCYSMLDYCIKNATIVRNDSIFEQEDQRETFSFQTNTKHVLHHIN